MRTIFWLGLGAAAMYLLDPEQGRRRRGQVREQLTRARERIRQRASGAGPALERDEPARAPEGAHHLGR
jgi:hypothetical protein